ncbi:uncharacterized protein [Epargyreus clarus]|uniref:uncharacterized protein n=1 Tax=Epargyreus clarus TaxID=520877 RepID=UPI003C305138
MSDRDNLESESDQPSAKKAKSHYDTPSSHQTQQSSQGSQNIIIETGRHQDQLNTRHTINVIVNNNKKERQKRYGEQNRDKLKQREAERTKRIQYSQSIAGPSTSSKTNRIELNNEEIITAQSSSGSEKIQPSSIQRNDQGNELNALQKKRERQQRYREQNRDKLKQREAERRRRLQNADVITELSTSPNIEFTEIINDPTIDEISTNSRNVSGLEEMQHVVVEVFQQIGRSQSSANTTEIPNNYSQFRYHKLAHEYFNDNFKNNEFGHACSICDRLWFEKDLKKPSASGNIINTITNRQNVDALKICFTCKSALDKNSIPNFDVKHL